MEHEIQMHVEISQQALDEYRQNGVVKVEQVISREEAAHYRKVTLEILQTLGRNTDAGVGDRQLCSAIDTH